MDDTEVFNQFIANTTDDLFADDDEELYLNEEEYRREKAESLDVGDMVRKKKAKFGAFSNSNFWKRDEKGRFEDKNHLWDFMIYNCIREKYFGNYKSKVESMNNQLISSILECRKNVINDITNQPQQSESSSSQDSGEIFDEEYLNQVEICFDELVDEALKGFKIKLDFQFGNQSGEEGDEFEMKREEIRDFLKKNKNVRGLFRLLFEFRSTKNEILKNSLHDLLKAFNELRNKVVKETYQDAKDSKMNLTRFVKNLDKLSSRFEFFCEYRYHNLVTYFKNKEVVSKFFNDYNAINNFTHDFTSFINNFNPNYTPKDQEKTTGFEPTTARSSTNEPNTETNETFSTQHQIDNIFDFMVGTAATDPVNTTSQQNELPQTNMVGPISQSNVVNNGVEANTVNQSTKDDEDEDLKILMDARKKAAEILRLKRMERLQADRA